MTKGKIYIVGAGPGDVNLLTLRAVECLKHADVILHDRLIPTEALHRFAPRAKLIHVGKKASYHTLEQDEIEDLLVKLARQDKTVVRLKGGDPFIFGRGGEECERLVREGIEFEVVPGISSAFAAPLFAGIPLTHRKFTPNIAIITGHENPDKPGENPYKHGVERGASLWVDWQAVSKMNTIVILMGMGNLRANMQKLMLHGKVHHTPAAVIRWGGLPRQELVLGTIADIADRARDAGLKAPAVIVVGDVVELSPELNWYMKKEKFGKTILITRDAEGNAKLARELTEQGANVIALDSFVYMATPFDSKLKASIKNISKQNWLVFTSERGVEFFLKLFYKVHKDLRVISKIKIAAVGKVTAQCLKENNLWVDLVPKTANAKALAKELLKKKKSRIAIVGPTDARAELCDILSKRHHVNKLTVYKKKIITHAKSEFEDIISKKIDEVIFYSPSAVEAFLKNFSSRVAGKKWLGDRQVKTIGRTTAKALKIAIC